MMLIFFCIADTTSASLVGQEENNGNAERQVSFESTVSEERYSRQVSECSTPSSSSSRPPFGRQDTGYESPTVSPRECKDGMCQENQDVVLQ